MKKRTKQPCGLKVPLSDLVPTLVLILDVGTKPRGFKEFPEIPVPAIVDIFGFCDESWHNDACARARLDLPHKGESLELWCNFPEHQNREETCYGPRYLLSWCRHECDTNPVALFYSEDENEIASAIVATLTSFASLRPAPTPWYRLGWNYTLSHYMLRLIRAGIDATSRRYLKVGMTVMSRLNPIIPMRPESEIDMLVNKIYGITHH
jgi:hypothetical protein